MSQHWQAALQSHFNLAADLKRLDGEYDLNFAASADGKDYIFKVMRAGCPVDLVDMQCAAIRHLSTQFPDLPLPELVPTVDGALYTTLPDEEGAERLVWLQTRLTGACYADYMPKRPEMIEQLGTYLGQMDAGLQDFTHPQHAVPFKWHLPTGDWIAAHTDIITDSARRGIIEQILQQFAALKPELEALPVQAIHNDLNDYNILVTRDGAVSGLIDFGDMTASPRICDLAIAGAYVVLDHDTPERALAALVRGYHKANPLTAAELDLLYPLLRMRLAVSVVNSTIEATENPDDPYVTISQAPAWRFLERDDIDAGLMQARLRAACGLPVVEGADRVLAYLNSTNGNFAPLMGKPLDDTPTGALSVAAVAAPRNPFDMPLSEAAILGAEYDTGDMWIGLWGEPRLIYTAPAFRQGPWKSSDRRTVHLAVDVFAPAKTPLHAPLDGVVEVIENRTTHLDYGGVIILRHETPDGTPFFTLYGHLAPDSLSSLKTGDTIAKGTAFCALGDASENGGWAPHVHFQLALTTEGMGHDWPGVANPDEMELWGGVCPNPAALLNLPDDAVAYQPMPKAETLGKRRKHFGENVKLSYSDPAMFLRGWKHHLFDEWGRPHLDAYNNVPHVGHAHPRIQAIAADQLMRMNSNTRYLHPAQTDFADTVLAKMPDPLSVCFFVNSGTEANELALRLAAAHSGGKDIITANHGYHGNTTGAIAISAYKFNAKGGVGQADWVQLVDVADDFAGPFRREDPDCADKYAAQIDEAIAAVTARGSKVSGWISEVFPSVGGQIIPPQGYLPQVYAKIRAAGGVCIADEVQTGLGRLGEHYFAFEQQGVTPDIVVLGKPIGNGHPIGVVVTTPEIAASFAQGPEYFSTFGGSTLSCRIGAEVLKIVDDEGLQENARQRGNELLDGLRKLQERHAVIGDIRGMGLFVGVDLVTDRETRAPATEIADRVINRMKENRILIGSEGAHHNVLKIRPPLTIDAEDIERILHQLDRIFSETACQP
ncbi:aminotransferase class III-fold pyridoxal phosphate-dependent enzyme [Neptunicoccus sediminis]|uniref:aminotransferase class III-fold pyridoxal phosphate-dependent enzyme n=1 Tax=Neptunicoccus sediminis TaxID=1892596 RepID=UPI000845F797|nr:aminotransferase class III-fold pyridoxal phosphate-dependent enzyme [Neptunicoccus sediminis]